jgi:hypothetical protein
MVIQFLTKTRPNLDVPFFEDSSEGKARADAIIQLALDHPELCVDRTTDPIPATELSWSGTWTFAGPEEFKQFMSLAHDADPTLRSDRARYYMTNMHELLVEYQGDGMDQRELQVHIHPEVVKRWDNTTFSIDEL